MNELTSLIRLTSDHTLLHALMREACDQLVCNRHMTADESADMRTIVSQTTARLAQLAAEKRAAVAFND